MKKDVNLEDKVSSQVDEQNFISLLCPLCAVVMSVTHFAKVKDKTLIENLATKWKHQVWLPVQVAQASGRPYV